MGREQEITREITLTDYAWPPADGGPQLSVCPKPSGGFAAVVEIGGQHIIETPLPQQLRDLAALLLAGAAELERAEPAGK